MLQWINKHGSVLIFAAENNILKRLLIFLFYLSSSLFGVFSTLHFTETTPIDQQLKKNKTLKVTSATKYNKMFTTTLIMRLFIVQIGPYSHLPYISTLCISAAVKV